jgi:hypothetical protein
MEIVDSQMMVGEALGKLHMDLVQSFRTMKRQWLSSETADR